VKREICIAAGCCLLVWTGRAEGLSLLERSPFIWPGFNSGRPAPSEAGPAATSGDFEFHAVYELSGRTHVLVRDRLQSKFLWLLLGEERDGLVPKSYDPDNNQLLLANSSGETWLSLQELPEVSGQPISMAPTTARTGAQVQRTTGTPRRTIVRPSTSTSRRSSGSSLAQAALNSRTSGQSVAPPTGPRVTRRATPEDLGITPPSYIPTGQDLSAPDTEAPSGGPPPPPSGSSPPPRR